MQFTEYGYKNIGQLKSDIEEKGINLKLSEDLSILGRSVRIGDRILPNSIAVHPMEGCDAEADGRPGELTIRRYDRFSKGNAGLIWFEAVAVVPEGKALKNQLHINKGNASSFASLYRRMKKNAQEEYGASFSPVIIMQLTHSGRYSKPEGKPAPMVSYHNPVLDESFAVDHNQAVISDDYLERLEEKFEEAAILAYKAGFDGVDVKCCHRYLNSELLSAFTRAGKYGGGFEGRTRLLLNVVDRVKARMGKDFIVATRMNIYDGIPHPYGWGMRNDGSCEVDLAEPLKLVGLLQEKGVRLINVTMGTPYYNPHVNRPYDKGGYVPPEHPLEGVERLINGAGVIQKLYPDIAVVGTGYSWLRELSPYLAAGCLENGLATIAGYGREAFAYPNFAREIFNEGMDRNKCCIACGKCAEILRAGGTSGCVIKDSAVYAPAYKKYCMSNK